MEDRSSGVSVGSGLFYFVVLSSYANFRTSYRRLDGIRYTIYPGEWICCLSEMRSWFRVPFQKQVISVLDELQKQHLITYTLLGRGNIVKFRIKGWRKYNTVLDYNAPCQKDSGFFFLPISVATEVVSTDRCSEMDCLLDLWINTIYNDEQVQGSDIGPVVYMRNGTGNPLISYSELAARWGLSKATVGRMLKRMEKMGYISLVAFPGNRGSVIYLQNYLSTMFQISDVMIDKEEVAMSLNIKITLPEEQPDDAGAEQNSGSKTAFRVSKSAVEIIAQKVGEILTAQGFSCFSCPKVQYKLYPLSDDCKGVLRGTASSQRLFLCVSCKDTELFHFELNLMLISQHTGGSKR